MKLRVLAATIAFAASSLVAVPASAQSGGVSAPFLTGVWKESPQCRGPEAMVFFANGTMSSAGSAAASYTVVGGNQIVLYGPGGQQSFGAQYVNQDKVILTLNNDATVVHRCSQGAAGNQFRSGGGNWNHQSPSTLSPATFAGGWGENGNCAQVDVFTRAGQFQPAVGPGGTWALFGSRLRMTMQNGVSVDAQVGNFTNASMNLNVGGQAVYYQRCF